MAEGFQVRPTFNPFAFPNSPSGHILVDPPTANRPLEEKGPAYVLYSDKRVFGWMGRVDVAPNVPPGPNGTAAYALEYFRSNCTASTPFNCGGWCGVSGTWRLQFNQHHYEHGVRYVSLYLWLQESKPAYVHTSCMYEMQILNSNGQPVATKLSGVRTFKTGDCYGWKKFAKFEDVANHLVAGKFAIKLVIEVIRLSSQVIQTQKPLIAPNSTVLMLNTPAFGQASAEAGGQRPGQTSQDCQPSRMKLGKEARKSMKKCKDIADGPVEIRTTLELFRVNKLLIAARSHKLYKLIQPESPGSPTSRLDLLEDDNLIVRSMCEYLYKNKCKLLEPGEDFENQTKLFEMAVKYEISELIKAAFQALCRGVSTETWINAVHLYRSNEGELGDPQKSEHGKVLKRFFLQNRTAIMASTDVKEYFQAHRQFLLKLLVL